MEKERGGFFKTSDKFLKKSPFISTISSLASLISSIGVIVGVWVYVSTSSDRQTARDLNLWANLGVQNTGKKYALQLFASDGVAMNSIVIQNSDLSSVVIPNASMTYSNICGSNFTNADLRNVDFGGATLDDNDFSYADLTGAKLEDLNDSNISYGRDPTQEKYLKDHASDKSLGTTVYKYNTSCGSATILMDQPHFQGPANNNISGAVLPDDLVQRLQNSNSFSLEKNFNYLFCVQRRSDTSWAIKYADEHNGKEPKGVVDENGDDYIIWPTHGKEDVKFFWPDGRLPICNPQKPIQAICTSFWCAPIQFLSSRGGSYHLSTIYSQAQYDTSYSEAQYDKSAPAPVGKTLAPAQPSQPLGKGPG